MGAAIVVAVVGFWAIWLAARRRVASGLPWVIATLVVTVWAWPWASMVGALVGVVPAFVWLHRPWRQRWVSGPAMRLLTRTLPPISPTEQVALDAGTVGLERQWFDGRPDWALWRQESWGALSPAEKAFVEGPCATLCAMLNDWAITHEHADLPPEVWAYMKEHGFFGMLLPVAHGGLGFSARAQSLVLQRLSSVSAVAASTVGVPNSLGPGELLVHYGTAEQQAYYLPRLARGEEVPCFALTGPLAGSDATALPDVGRVVRTQDEAGNTALELVLTFDKRYITLAPVATLIGLAFRLQDPEGLLGEGPVDRGITLALMPQDTPGLIIGERHFPLNVPFQNGPLSGHEVRLPLSAIIGGPARIGQGWRMLVECLSVGRGITLPSNAAGASAMLALATGAYARVRHQFGRPIGQFEGVQEALGPMAAHAYATRALARSAAEAVDRHEKPAITASITKHETTERARAATQAAMDIHGGKAIQLGPHNYVARAWQGAPIAITVEGANIMTRSLMIFGQGALRAHPHVLTEMRAAAAQDLDAFDAVLRTHLRNAWSNAARAWAAGWTASGWVPALGPVARPEESILWSRLSAQLALLTDVALGVLGGQLKLREAISARLGDVLSQLHTASCVRQQFEHDGRPVEDALVVRWLLQDSAHRAEHAIEGVLQNFPHPGIARLLRAIVLPRGARTLPPPDAWTFALAHQLMQSGGLRDRLAQGAYMQPSAYHPAGQMCALLEVAERQEARRAQRKAAVRMGRIAPDAEDEALVAEGIWPAEALVEQAQDQARLKEALTVDAFAPTALGAAGEPMPQ